VSAAGYEHVRTFSDKGECLVLFDASFPVKKGLGDQGRWIFLTVIHGCFSVFYFFFLLFLFLLALPVLVDLNNMDDSKSSYHYGRTRHEIHLDQSSPYRGYCRKGPSSHHHFPSRHDTSTATSRVLRAARLLRHSFTSARAHHM
jgi:hypothetical protein